MNSTDKFIQYLINKSENIPDRVLEKSKDCLLDYLAVTYAGAETNKEQWKDVLKLSAKGKAEVLGYSEFVDGKTAALINGFNAHSLELDDGQRFAMIHLGASIVSALLSVSAECEATREDLLKGLVMGYEAACRLSVAMQPSHKKLGYHTAGTCGTVGAAIACAFLLNMNEEQMKRVLSSAVAGAAGLLEIQEQKSELKPYNLGRAAMDGTAAAYMGLTPFQTPDDILNGERGFFHLFSKEYDPEKLTEDKESFEIEKIYVKPYAACRHCHSAIEAILSLREQVKMDDISSIIIETYQLAVKGHDHHLISGTASAKLSMPYSVAAALVLGRADVSAFDAEHINNKKIKLILEKIKVVENEEFSKLSSKKRIARVTVNYNDGASVSKQIDYAKGDPENPMSRKEIIDKAYSLVGNKASDIIEYCYKN